MPDIVNKTDEMGAEVPPFFERLEALPVVVEAVEKKRETPQYNASDLEARH
jgi:hypothetical protein